MVAQNVQAFLDRAAATAGVEADDLVIQMGRNGRIIYGDTARGFREEVSESRLALLQELTRCPAIEDLTPGHYENKRPEIEIRTKGGESIFRQEYDGNISVNYLPLDPSIENLQLDAVEFTQAPARVSQMVKIAEQIAAIDALPSTAHGKYTIKHDADNLSVSQADRGEILTVREGVVSANLTSGDLNRFAAIQQALESQGFFFAPSPTRIRIEPDNPVHLMTPDTWLHQFGTYENWKQEADAHSLLYLGDTPQSVLSEDEVVEFSGLASRLLDPTGLEQGVLQAEVHDYVLEKDGDRLTVSKWVGEDLSPILVADGATTLFSSVTPYDLQSFNDYSDPSPAFEPEINQIAEPEGAINLAANSASEATASERSGLSWIKNLTQGVEKKATQLLDNVRSGLNSEQAIAVNAAIENTVDRGVAAAKTAWESEAAKELRGQVAESVKSGAKQGWQWLKSRPEAIRDYRVAQAAYTAFEKGNNRTQETSYDLGGGYQVEMRGLKNFALRKDDADLMTFSADKAIPGLPPSLKIQSISPEMSRADYQKVEEVRQSGFQSRGTPEAEVRYSANVTRVDAIATAFLHHMNESHWDSPNYKISAADVGVKIEAKDGRGVIYSGSTEPSQLTPKDFHKFEQVAQAMRQDLTQGIGKTQLDHGIG